MYNYEDMIQYQDNFISEEDLVILNSFFPKIRHFSPKDVAFAPPIYGGQTLEHKTEIDDEEVIKLMDKYTELSRQEAQKRFIDDRGYTLKEYCGHSGNELIRWSTTGSLAPHADGNDFPPPFPSLDVACLMYLNDEYEGGEINFPEHDIMIKPKPGTIVFFPCHYVHEVMEVTENPNGPTRRHTMPLFHWFHVNMPIV